MATTEEKLKEYINWDPIPESSTEIKKILETKQFDEINENFFKRLEFGTAGLRGAMGNGYNKLNGLTVLQTTQVIFIFMSKRE